MFPGTSSHPALAALAQRQRGALRRDQLRAVGVSWAYAVRQIDAQRWTEHGLNMLLCSNASPTRDQLKWLAVMDVSGLSALASHTALEEFGFRPFATEARDLHLLVQRGATYARLDGVVHHESRRLHALHVVTPAALPATRPARSAIDAAAWQRWPRFACAMLASVVQQGLCTPAQLDRTLAVVGRVRHKAHMRLALIDIATGAHTLGETDVATLCRRFSLRPPDRQRRRRDASGHWRYLDCEWDLEDGSTVVLEVDGGHHRLVEHWEADMKRERKVIRGRRTVLRATNYEVRHDQAEVADDLRAVGVPVVRVA